MGKRIEQESRIGRVWSLCWIALEIGSINLHTSATRQTHTNKKRAAAFLCPEGSGVEPPACPLIWCSRVCDCP